MYWSVIIEQRSYDFNIQCMSCLSYYNAEVPRVKVR